MASITLSSKVNQYERAILRQIKALDKLEQTEYSDPEEKKQARKDGYALLQEMFSAFVQAVRIAYEGEKDPVYAAEASKRLKKLLEGFVKGHTPGHLDIWGLEKRHFARKEPMSWPVTIYYNLLLVEARNRVLDSYFQYLERRRRPQERFYMPSRKQFVKFGITQAFQDILDDKLDIICLSMPPGTKKTTFEKFFMTGVIGWYPTEFSLFYSHSGDITKMFYKSTLDIVTDQIEYCWGEIFPDLAVNETDAKTLQFNVGPYKSFPSMQTTSIGAKNAGKVRASKFLLVDDLIGSIQEALNKNTLEKIWQAYATDGLQRKTVDENDVPCKEIHIATRWSVRDVIGRLQELYPHNSRVKFISVPALDPKTDRSNFEFEFRGFSTEFFKQQRKVFDEISFNCLYQQKPMEREGLLYPADELRRFITMPEREPDAILAVCDTKTKGIDYMVLPVLYQYGTDYYMVDCVCDDNSDFGVQKRKIADIIEKHSIQRLEFESNVGGDRLADDVAAMIATTVPTCSITTKYTETNKEARIMYNADFVKRNILFRTEDKYSPRGDYGRFMEMLCTYTLIGRNAHDDVPDALANFTLFVRRETRTASVMAVKNPFMWEERDYAYFGY